MCTSVPLQVPIPTSTSTPCPSPALLCPTLPCSRCCCSSFSQFSPSLPHSLAVSPGGGKGGLLLAPAVLSLSCRLDLERLGRLGACGPSSEPTGASPSSVSSGEPWGAFSPRPRRPPTAAAARKIQGPRGRQGTQAPAGQHRGLPCSHGFRLRSWACWLAALSANYFSCTTPQLPALLGPDGAGLFCPVSTLQAAALTALFGTAAGGLLCLACLLASLPGCCCYCCLTPPALLCSRRSACASVLIRQPPARKPHNSPHSLPSFIIIIVTTSSLLLLLPHPLSLPASPPLTPLNLRLQSHARPDLGPLALALASSALAHFVDCPRSIDLCIF